MKINFDKNFLQLDGSEFTLEKNNVDTMAKTLAHNLSINTKHLVVFKAYDFAKELYKTGGVIIDKTDADLLKKDIEGFQVANWVKAQLVEIIKEAETNEEKTNQKKGK